MANPPKPIEKKRLEGNAGKRALPEPQILVPQTSGVPEPPAHLEADGLAAWERIWANASAWVSDLLDVALVERYCSVVDEVADMLRVLEHEGRTYTLDTGQVRAHPFVKLVAEMRRDLTKWEGLMALNPSDRSRLGLIEVKKQSALEAFMANRGAPTRKS